MSCEPAVGTSENLNNERPWLESKRKPLTEHRKLFEESNGTCYLYKTAPGDSVSSVVDALELDIRDFVLRNAAAEKLGKVADLTYRFSSTLRSEEIASVLQIATNVKTDLESLQLSVADPYVTCWHYDAKGNVIMVTCNSLDKNGNLLCEKKGTVGKFLLLYVRCYCTTHCTGVVYNCTRYEQLYAVSRLIRS